MQTQKCEHASFKEIQNTLDLFYVVVVVKNTKVGLSKIRNTFDKIIV